MEIIILIAIASGLGGVGLGWVLKTVLHRYPSPEPAPPDGSVPDKPEHEHRYDTMLADGKGWRCGICDKPKGKR